MSKSLATLNYGIRTIKFRYMDKQHKNKGRKFTDEHKRKISLAHLGKKLSNEHKKNLSLSHKGKPNPKNAGANSNLWRGGITPINKYLRTCTEYKLWRTSVFERDNYTCIWCGANRKNEGDKRVELNADHIKPFSQYPELRFAIDNGRTLCVECHKKTETFSIKNIKDNK